MQKRTEATASHSSTIFLPFFSCCSFILLFYTHRILPSVKSDEAEKRFNVAQCLAFLLQRTVHLRLRALQTYFFFSIFIPFISAQKHNKIKKRNFNLHFFRCLRSSRDEATTTEESLNFEEEV
jgi:hypothetical protein